MNENMNNYAEEFEHWRRMALALSLTREELFSICDMGFYNGVIAGYLKMAMEVAGFNYQDIQKAIKGLHYALDIMSAAEADLL